MQCAVALALASAAVRADAAPGAFGFLADVPGGARWRGMGGAARAVAADPDAAFWNPAGLAWQGPHVWQAGATFAAADAYGSAGSLAGSWLSDRAGTFGLAWARRAVDGLERVDALGVVAGGAEEAAEDAVLLAWARPLLYQVRAGASLTLLRHALPGATARGGALDLGLTAQPLLDQPVWLALTGENLASGLAWGTGASDRLARGIAAAAAWRGWRRRLLVAADLTAREGNGLGVHAGAEIRPVAFAAARCGWDDGALAAGASYEIGAYALDYAFTAGRTGLAPRHQATFRVRY